MKHNKAAYLSIFFLVCFVTAFSFNNYFRINQSGNNSISQKHQSVSFSQGEQNNSNSNDFLFEENETKNEINFSVLAIILPYIVSFVELELKLQLTTSIDAFTSEVSNPIYISAHSFRI